MTQRFRPGISVSLGSPSSRLGGARAEPTNDNRYIRLAIRNDRATVVVIGYPDFGPRLARMFTGADSAGATEYAHEIAEVLGTRVQYVVIDRGTERSGWLPVAYHQERAS